MAGPETHDTAEKVGMFVDRWRAEGPTPDGLARVLRGLGIWRAKLLANTYVRKHGAGVGSGPFAGMTLVGHTEGALMPKLLGTYESELHPVIRRFAASDIEAVIDIGCAEGFYAVGWARLMPAVTVYAHDISPAAQQVTKATAEANGVADRVIIGGEFRPEQFEAFRDRRTLVFIDAEGAEIDVLRPDLAPALTGMHLIVETHKTLDEMIRRFEPTHKIEVIRQQPRTTDLPDWIMDLSEMDIAMATWEQRGGLTPWLVMTPNGNAST